MEDKFNNKYRIETCRLSGWDYSRSGFYFITICTINRELFFGTVHTQNFASAPKMALSKIGKIAQKCWLEIPNHFPFITLDEYVIMPNHIHGILEIKKSNVETQNFVMTHRVYAVINTKTNSDRNQKTYHQ